MKYEKMVREIVEAIGGKENILNVYHCATRLRFQLKQEDTIQDETVKNIEGVLSVVKGGGQYQICLLYTSFTMERHRSKAGRQGG